MPNDLFDVVMRKRIAARNNVVAISRRITRNTMRIARDPTAVAKVDALMRELELACRDLAELVDDSPPRTRPRGWAKDAEGRTA
jgi:hypothetical protein